MQTVTIEGQKEDGMIHGARILIVEDDPGWIETLWGIFAPFADQLDVATTTRDAKALLEDRYYNLAIVDVSLHLADDRDSQGMEILAHLRETGLDEAIQCIMLSAYGSVERVRRSFNEFKVVDFIDKAEFSEAELLQIIEKALNENDLGHPLVISISHNRSLSDFWQPFNWPKREDPSQLEAELRDLLARLFPDAERLFITDMPTGQSGAGMLKVTPTYDRRLGPPSIVKFGKRDKITIECENYQAYVANFAGNQSATQLGFVSGRAMAAVFYRLIGTELDRVVDFGDYYENHDVPEIQRVLDQIFLVVCKYWYDNRRNPRMANVIQIYEKSLHINWDEVWRFATETPVEFEQPLLLFPGLEPGYPNPKIWLEEHEYEVNVQLVESVTHGDLNETNVLVTPRGRCWLIDFYRTGWGHILADAVELETAIKLNLVSDITLQEYAELESYLLRQNRIDKLDLPAEDHPLYKPLAVIAHLRGLADILTGVDKGMDQYNLGLFMTALKVLGIEAFEKHRVKALLSASMLCDRLPTRKALHS
jgi:CheY-like chemotaxis protein